MKFLIFSIVLMIAWENISSQNLSDTNKIILKTNNDNNFYVFTGASNVSGGRIGAGFCFSKRISLEASIGGALQYEGKQPLIISSALNYQLNKKTSLINSLSMMVVYGKINSQASQKKLSVSPTIGSIFKVYNNLNLFYRLGYFTTINHFKHSGIHFDAGVRYYLI